MLSRASRKGLGHFVLPLGFQTTSMITGMPTIVSASCTLVSAFIFPTLVAMSGGRYKPPNCIANKSGSFSPCAGAPELASRVGSMSATGEPSAKRAKPQSDAAAERAHLLTTLLQYQASRKPADDVAAGPAEAACEAQLRESLTAAVLHLPPSRVVSKGALAAFKQQHVAMCRVAEAVRLSKPDPNSGEVAALDAADAKPPPQADEPVKSEL